MVVRKQAFSSNVLFCNRMLFQTTQPELCHMLHISFVVRMKLRLSNTNYMEYERQGLN